MVVTDSGIVIEVKLKHSKNAYAAISVTRVLDKSIEVKFEQFWKAP